MSRQRCAWRDQQLGVFAQRPFRRLASHLLGDDGDGGQRRAELVRRGGGQGAQRRQPLLARQHRLGDVERQLHPRRLGRRLVGVAGGEGDADDQRDGEADAIDDRQHAGLADGQGSGRAIDRQARAPRRSPAPASAPA